MVGDNSSSNIDGGVGDIGIVTVGTGFTGFIEDEGGANDILISIDDLEAGVDYEDGSDGDGLEAVIEGNEITITTPNAFTLTVPEGFDEINSITGSNSGLDEVVKW